MSNDPNTIGEMNDKSNAGFRAAKNTAILAAIRVTVPLISFALVLTISRMLGTEGLGQYTLAFSFLTLFNALGPLGLSTVIARDGARARDTLPDLLPNAIVLGAAASLMFTGFMIALGPLLNYDPATQSALQILSLAIFPSTVAIFMDRAFVALERMEYIAIATVCEHGLKIGLAIALLLNGYGLNAVLLAAVAGKLLAVLISLYFLRSNGILLDFHVRAQTLKMLVRLAPVFFLITVFASLQSRVGIIVLSKLGSITDIGLYGAAQRIYILATIIPQSLCLSLYPQIAVMRKENPEDLERLAKTAFRFLTAITLPVAVCVTLLSESMLGLLFGPEFHQASYTLIFLIWTILPFSAVRYNAYVLLAADRQRVDLLMNIILLFINIALNLFLIPRYGHTGAAIATLLSITILSLLQYGYLRSYLPGYSAPFVIQPSILVASILAGICAYTLNAVSIIIALVLTPLLYLVAIFFTGFFQTEELQRLHLDGVLKRFTLTRYISRR